MLVGFYETVMKTQIYFMIFSFLSRPKLCCAVLLFRIFLFRFVPLVYSPAENACRLLLKRRQALHDATFCFCSLDVVVAVVVVIVCAHKYFVAYFTAA